MAAPYGSLVDRGISRERIQANELYSVHLTVLRAALWGLGSRECYMKVL